MTESNGNSAAPILAAVITGGTRGIGLAIAESLVKRKASAAVTYQSNEADAQSAVTYLKSLASDGQKILKIKGDAGDLEAVKANYREAREALGPLNVLVNNAGIMPQASFEDITYEMWAETLRINLDGAFYWCKQVVPEMKANRFGRIINVASIAARGGGVIGPHYAASKAGMVGMTHYAARDLGPSGITVNAIAPAFIEDAGIFTTWNEGQKDGLRAKITVPNLGRARDVARAFEYLLDTPFVNGVCLDVNGGAFMI